MNKTILILAVLAICLAPTAFSAEMKENENRELKGIKLGNIKDLIGDIVEALKNKTDNNNNDTNTKPTKPTTPVTPPATNNTAPESDDSDSEAPSTNTTTPTTPTNPTTPNTTTPTTPPPTPVKYAKNDVNMATLKDDCLKVHNQVRMDVGLSKLTWSDSLAASAQTWAENMAKKGLKHSGKSGENIASSTYSTKTISRLLGLWTKEKNYYIVGCKYPKCSSNGKDVGHYTQMVWAKTTQVGCGFAPGYNRGWNYLCCQYYRAGNVVGQTVYPVTTA